jgi:hypothetical protein
MVSRSIYFESPTDSKKLIPLDEAKQKVKNFITHYGYVEPTKPEVETEVIEEKLTETTNKNTNMTKNQILQQFIPKDELKAIITSEEHKTTVERIYNIISEMPSTTQQDGLGENQIAFLHYFIGGSDWYITEKDMGDPANNDYSQYQAYGYAILNGDMQNAEMGYISLEGEEGLLEIEGMQLDLFFNPTSIKEIKQKFGGTIYDEELTDELRKEYSKIFELQEKFSGGLKTETQVAETIEEKVETPSQKAIEEQPKEQPKVSEQPDINTQFIDLAKGRTQYDNTIAIRKLIDEKGLSIEKYSQQELYYLRKYEGLGGLQNKGFGEREILDQFFTPYKVIEKMWGLAFNHAFKEAKPMNVLEPSAGIGRVLEYVPANCKVDAYEVDYYSYVIAKLTFPKFNIVKEYLESIFFSGNRRIGLSAVSKRYDLVIGNPPYSDFSGKYAGIKDHEGVSEQSETLAETTDQYFIARGVDLLKENGILIYVVPSTFLHNDNKYNAFKEKLSKKCELIDAYRLPIKTFENTTIGTDIIVLKRNNKH